jgi:hypothetical protein
VVAVARRGGRPGGPLEHQHAADACAKRHVVVRTGRVAHVHQVVLDRRREPHCGNLVPDVRQGFGLHDLRHVVERLAGAVAMQDLALRVTRRSPHVDAQQEAVELGLGKRERARMLHRVLGGGHEERCRQRVGASVDGDLPLGHRLEQGRLGARRGSVDLVDEDERGEQRAGTERERAGSLVEHVDAGDLCGQQVGCALDATCAQPRGRREPAHGGGLARTGDILDQHVSLTEHGQQQPFELRTDAYQRTAEHVEDCI